MSIARNMVSFAIEHALLICRGRWLPEFGAAQSFDPFLDSDAVANFPTLNYSVRDVRRAGDALKGHILWDSPDDQANALVVFAIANSWRDFSRVSYEAATL